jgi:quinol monooxygenase YgiN
MAFAIAARWLAKDGEGEAVQQALVKLTRASQAEPGCLMFQPLRDPDNPDAFFIFEMFVDKEAWETHRNYPHVVENRERGAGPLLEINEPTFYETIEV